MGWWAWVAIAAAVLAVAALVLGIVLYRRQGEVSRRMGLDGRPSRPGHHPQETADDADRRGPLVAFVANPSKPDVEALRRQVISQVAARGMPEPLWLETSIEDPGVGQARTAVAAGASVVVAIGGDGTVRAVAEALVGTHVPMGLLPLGTGNLLARNLDIPLGNPREALRVALTGVDRTIDVGWVRILDTEPDPSADPIAPSDPARWPSDEDEEAEDTEDAYSRAVDTAPDEPREDEPRDHIFLVIAGLGFDAAMVADTDDSLKARVGWIAYFMAGVRHLHGRRLRALVRIDDRPPAEVRLRSLLIGNCGKLPGGLTLLPDAVLDDGWLDIAAIDTRGGVAGWAQLFGEVMLQGVGVRTDLPAKIGRIDHARARTVLVRVSTPEHVQVDGDVIGQAQAVSARVEAGALVVRVPHA
jgi:diacylglycerol kinase family enzyme